MNRAVLVGMMGLMLSPAAAKAGLVWESTFDSTADGVVDLKDQNTGKAMIGANIGGAQQIAVADNLTNAYTPDKAGRPLGATIDATDSFSARYVFSWSTLAESATDVYNFAGFMGDANPQTRQVMGSLMIFRKGPTATEIGQSGAPDPEDYLVTPVAVFGSVGATNFGQKAASTVNLGPDAKDATYQLVISFDGTSKELSVALLTEGGTILSDVSGIIEFGDIIAPPFGTAEAELNGYSATHLGWSDYTGNATNTTITWDTDSLAYYDTAGEALAAAVPEPASLLLLLIGGAAVTRRRAC